MSTAKVAPRPTGSPSNSPARRNYLAEIKTEISGRPLAAIWYGVPGIGKTSMAAHIPDVIFMADPSEDGITTLKKYGRVPKSIPQLPSPKNFPEVLDMLDWLATAEHSHKCLAMDAMGGFERLCHEEVCRRDFRGEWGDKGFGSYQKGYQVSLTDWRLMLNALDRLRDQKAMSVIVLAHSNVKNFRNPEGPDFDRYIPDVNPATWQLTHKWADMVLFMNFVTVVDKDGKGQGGQERLMSTEYHPAYDAKNRMGLPSTIEMGGSGQEAWANLRTALAACVGKDGE